jgi:maltooligosyltrehalose trehalohydrolase
MSALVPDRLLEISAAIVLLSPFLPMLFQGEEWGASSSFLYFTDHPDPALGDAVREGRRHEFASFGWDPNAIPDPQDIATFSKSKLDWTEIRRAPHDGLLEWHRRLIALRAAELHSEGLRPRNVTVDEDARCIVVQAGRLIWSVNFSSTAQVVVAPCAVDEPIMANDAAITVEHDRICMSPHSIAVFRSR